MSRRSPITLDEVRRVARIATSALEANGLLCCVFGSLACNLYGTTRTPNDVDLVVFTSRYTQEELKALIARSDQRFYLVPSKTLFATYQVFYFRLDGYKRSCKVDILLPGIMNIPTIPSRRIVKIHDIPVMPFAAVLLLKLQGWSDHRESRRTDMVRKQHVDVRDINQMLEIASARGLSYPEETWLPQDLLDAAANRVQEYAMLFPETSSLWEEIGFDTT